MKEGFPKTFPIFLFCEHIEISIQPELWQIFNLITFGLHFLIAFLGYEIFFGSNSRQWSQITNSLLAYLKIPLETILDITKVLNNCLCKIIVFGDFKLII